MFFIQTPHNEALSPTESFKATVLFYSPYNTDFSSLNF